MERITNEVPKKFQVTIHGSTMNPAPWFKPLSHSRQGAAFRLLQESTLWRMERGLYWPAHHAGRRRPAARSLEHLRVQRASSDKSLGRIFSFRWFEKSRPILAYSSSRWSVTPARKVSSSTLYSLSVGAMPLLAIELSWPNLRGHFPWATLCQHTKANESAGQE